MAILSPSSPNEQSNEAPECKTENARCSTSQRRKRQKSPGVRVKGSRIYDSQNGKTCHQCRQKTMDFVATCKNKTDDKPCTFHFCHKCLLNRYGEEAEEMALLNDWMCPRCRGICNCSFCMKKRGGQPTGILIHVAKANGFCSVSEMLHLKGSKNLGYQKMVNDDVGAFSKKQKISKKEPAEVPSRKCGKQGCFEGLNGLELLDELLKVNGLGVETKITKPEMLRNNDENRNASEGIKVSVLAQKNGPEKWKLPKESSKRMEENHGTNNGRELIKMNAHIKVPKRTSQEFSKTKGRETKALNNRNDNDTQAEHKLVAKSQKFQKNCTAEFNSKASDIEFLLHHGIESKNVTAEDVRDALQFLEFCDAVRKEPAVAVTSNCGKQKGFGPRNLKPQAEPLIANCQELEITVSKLKQLSDKDGYETASGVNKDIDSIAPKSSPKKHENSKGSSKRKGKMYKRSGVEFPTKTYPESIQMKNRDDDVSILHYKDTVGKHESVAESHHTDQKHTKQFDRKASDKELPLSQGVESKCQVATDVLVEDGGHLLQLQEICEAFEEVLNLKNGPPQQLL